MELASATTIFTWWIGVAPAIATTLTVLWVMYCFIKEFLTRPRTKTKKKK